MPFLEKGGICPLWHHHWHHPSYDCGKMWQLSANQPSKTAALLEVPRVWKETKSRNLGCFYSPGQRVSVPFRDITEGWFPEQGIAFWSREQVEGVKDGLFIDTLLVVTALLLNMGLLIASSSSSSSLLHKHSVSLVVVHCISFCWSFTSLLLFKGVFSAVGGLLLMCEVAQSSLLSDATKLCLFNFSPHVSTTRVTL